MIGLASGRLAAERYYGVFISSTYEDLQLEREAAIRTLLRLRAIPSGMELFTASNQPPWDLIKQTIDLCDYYLVIVGNRYGSRMPAAVGLGDVSYTEAEYDYAHRQGKPVMAFVHANPGQLPFDKSSTALEDLTALELFRAKVNGRSRVVFDSPSTLSAEIGVSWETFKKENPAAGWVRARDVNTAESVRFTSSSAGPTSPPPNVNNDLIRATPHREPTEVEVALANWGPVKGDTVDVLCELFPTASHPFGESAGSSLSTIVHLTRAEILAAVSEDTAYAAQSTQAVTSGVGVYVLDNRTTLFDPSFLASMDIVEKRVRQQAAKENSPTVGTPTDAWEEHPATWHLEVDAPSKKNIRVILKRLGMLIQDGDLWRLSNAAVELYESDVPESPRQ